MKELNYLLCFSTLLLFTAPMYAQVRKIDTTAKMGDSGFRVTCKNKNDNLNTVNVSFVGVKNAQRDVDLSAPGRVTKVIADDLNNDGLPDLVMCVYGGLNGETGTIIGIAGAAEGTMVPVFFPDIYLDPKNREGYKGHDEFTVIGGTLLRKFPLYLPADTTGMPTGGKRTIQYNVTSEQGHLKFTIARSFVTKPGN